MERHLSSVECMLVRETMVRQEKMYREQVQALHYLYEVQKTLMEERLSKNSGSSPLQAAPAPLRDHQFFPVKSEKPETERVRRNFDLEKLPDECLEEEEKEQLDVKPRLIDLNASCNGDADVELVLNCGSHSKRPRYENHENVQVFKASLHSQEPLTGLNSQSQNGSKSQPHWLMEDSRKLELNAWSHLKHTAGLFQHGNSNSWFPQEASQTPPRLWSNGLGLGSLEGTAAAPWYNQVSSATHPWQVSGAAYFSGATYSPFVTPNGFLNGFPNGISASTITSTKTPYGGSPDTTDLGVYLQQQRQKNGRQQQHSNGYSNTLLDSLMAREVTEGYSAGLLGDRNFYRDIHTSKACNLETRFLTLASETQQDYWKQVGASKVNAWRSTESDVQVELSLVPTRAGGGDGGEGIKLAASILMTLSQDKTFCPSKENSPPLLKRSVQWFAEAIPTEDEEQEKSMDKEAQHADEFEMACFQLQPCKFDDYAPIRVDAILETALSPRNKTSKTASGRPKRVGKKQRDFRNDTLPSITSLSRQEITEDFQIMSGLMRSTRDQQQQQTDSTGITGAGCSQTRRGSKACNGKQAGSTGPTLEVNKTGTGGTGNTGTGSLPWLVSWGESTRRKRQQRQRSTALPPLSQKLTVLNSTVSTRARR